MPLNPCSDNPEEVIGKIIASKTAADKFVKFVNGGDLEEVQLGHGETSPTLRNLIHLVKSAAATLDGSDVSGKFSDAANGSTVLRMLADRFGDIVNVRDFSAKGDGIADDTEEINAAIEYAWENDAKMVVFPSGTYNISDTIVIHSNLNIAAVGRVIINRTAGSTIFGFPVEDTASADDDVYFGVHDTAVDGFVFEGNGGIVSDQFQHISMAYTNNIAIKNCIFKNRKGTHDIEVSGCRNIQIENCRFEGFYEPDADGTDRECIQLEYSAGGIYGIPDYFTVSKNITIRNCYFGAGDQITQANGAGVGAHNAAERRFSAEDVLIDNCVFDNLKSYGVSIYTSRNYTVQNCTFINGNRYNIRIVCVRNIVDRAGNQLPGVGMAPEGIFILNNMFEYSGENYCIYTRTDADQEDVRIKNTIISGNNFFINGTGGLALRFFKGAVISNNVFSGEMTIVASSLYCEDINFCGNTFSGYTANGLYFPNNKNTNGNNTNISILSNHFNMSAQTNISGARSILFVGGSSKPFENVIVKGNSFVGKRGENNPCPVAFNYVKTGVFTSNSFFIEGSVKPVIEGLSTCENVSISNISISPQPESPDNIIYGQGGRASVEQTFSSNTFFKSNVNGIPAVSIYGHNAASSSMSIAAVRMAGAAHLSFGAIDCDMENPLMICEVGAEDGSLPYFRPMSSSGANLGTATRLWANVHAASGTISTSDSRLKEGVCAPSDALMRAWGKVGFKVFQMKDAVAEKGVEKARLHIGVIAQEVMDAFASEGLDAGRYGLFCHDRWDDEWEEKTVVDAPAVYNKDGVEIEPEKTHVERRLVQTAGDRYGIRYEEALALECTYQRWRLEQIEARLNEISGNGPAPSGASPDNI